MSPRPGAPRARYRSALLAVVVAGGLVAGCGGQDSPAVTTSPTAPSAQGSSAAPAPTASAEATEPSSGGGPATASIEGSWQLSCQAANETCPDFSITFSANGDIVTTSLRGHHGAQKGTGTLEDSTVTFQFGYGPVYGFSGTLDGAGTVATGTLTSLASTGAEQETAATLSRQ